MDWNKDEVKGLRVSLHMTQMEFAELLGCRQQTISEWEQGLYFPGNAYGKLLTQVKSRVPESFAYKKPLNPKVLPKTSPLKEEDLSEIYEERPFDPAID